MKLIDLLINELPKRGGWPVGVDAVYQNARGCLVRQIFQSGCTDAEIDIAFDVLADDMYKGVLREQYESALAASKTEWNGDGLPPVGVEFEHSFHADSFSTWHCRRCTAVGKHGVLCIDEKDTEIYLNDTNNRFRPIRSEADKKRYAAIEALFEILDAGVSTSQDSIDIYDAIAAGKIPHIRID